MYRYDCIALPCVRLLPDGTADPELFARARLAAAYHREGMAPRVLASGGTAGDGPSEAAVAAKLLIKLGVPPGGILLDEVSLDTPGNAREARRLLGGGTRVLVVTSDYHLRRAVKLYRRAGLAAEGRAAASPNDPLARHRRRMEWLYRIDLFMGWHDGRRARPKWIERAFYALFPTK